MEYTKIRMEFKYGPKGRFYRTLLIKGNPNLFDLGVALGTAVGAEFEHCFLLGCPKEKIDMSWLLLWKNPWTDIGTSGSIV